MGGVSGNGKGRIWMTELIPWESGKIGPRIRLVREARGLRMADLEARVGLSAGNLYQIERGVHDPRVDTLFLIAQALEVSADELLGLWAGVEAAELRRANRDLGIQLGAAQRDLRSLDACPVCGWWDGDGCRAPKDVKMSGSCFAWRGAERARLWEG